MSKFKTTVVPCRIRRISDSRFLYLLKTGEIVFTRSVSSVFLSFKSAMEFTHDLGLTGCVVERVY